MHGPTSFAAAPSPSPLLPKDNCQQSATTRSRPLPIYVSYTLKQSMAEKKGKMASSVPSNRRKKQPEICVKEEFKIAVKIALDRFRFEEKQKGKSLSLNK